MNMVTDLAKLVLGKEVHVTATEVEFKDEDFESVMDTPFELDDTLEVVEHFQDLPQKGELGKTYKVLKDLSLWKWNDSFNGYDEYNPYDTNSTTIVDASSHMPFGGSANMQFLYNLWALQSDLNFLKKYQLGLESLIPKEHRNASNLPLKFIETNHTAFYNQIRKYAISNKQLNPIFEGLMNTQGCMVWLNKETNTLGFAISYESNKPFKFSMKI